MTSSLSKDTHFAPNHKTGRSQEQNSTGEKNIIYKKKDYINLENAPSIRGNANFNIVTLFIFKGLKVIFQYV